MIGPRELGKIPELEVELLHLVEDVGAHTIGSGRHAEGLLLRVGEQDVDEVASRDVAGQCREAVETIVGIGIDVQQLGGAEKGGGDLRLLALPCVQGGVLDRERGLGRDAGRELALQRGEGASRGSAAGREHADRAIAAAHAREDARRDPPVLHGSGAGSRRGVGHLDDAFGQHQRAEVPEGRADRRRRPEPSARHHAVPGRAGRVGENGGAPIGPKTLDGDGVQAIDHDAEVERGSERPTDLKEAERGLRRDRELDVRRRQPLARLREPAVLVAQVSLVKPALARDDREDVGRHDEERRGTGRMHRRRRNGRDEQAVAEHRERRDRQAARHRHHRRGHDRHQEEVPEQETGRSEAREPGRDRDRIQRELHVDGDAKIGAARHCRPIHRTQHRRDETDDRDRHPGEHQSAEVAEAWHRQRGDQPGAIAGLAEPHVDRREVGLLELGDPG